MQKKEKNLVVVISLLIIVIFIVGQVLYMGRNLIIPFIIALLFSSAILGLSSFYNKRWNMPKFFAILASLFTYVLIFWIIGNIISSNIDEIIKKLPDYQERFTAIILDILRTFGFHSPTSFEQLFSGINLQSMMSYMFGAFTGILSSLGVIFFYTLFILLEAGNFQKKLKLIFVSNFSKNHVFDIITKVKKDIKGYFLVKALASFSVGLYSYIIMLIFGLDFAPFWAMLIFILNFIPYVGSIIAVIFPSVLSLAQADFSIYNSTVMISLLILGQLVVGNILEPKLMGNKLNLSPLVIILSLAFWGALWGVLGMLLCVPIMVIINIVLSKIPATRPIAILLSEKGDLEIKPAFYEEEKTKSFLKKMLSRNKS